MSQQEKEFYRAQAAESVAAQRRAAKDAGLPAQKTVPEHAPPSASTFAQTLLGGRYSLLFLFGAGAYGTVYRAKDIASGAIHACKVEPLGRSLFVEVATLQKVAGHPAFLQVLNSNLDAAGLSWMIIPLVRNSLKELLPLKHQDETLAVCMQSLSGLAYLHQLSLLHGDVKPSNLLFDSISRCLKIIDFSLTLQFPVSKPTKLCTANYRPPELFVPANLLRASWIAPTVDSWAIGVCILECVWAGAFFPGKDDAQVGESVVRFCSDWNIKGTQSQQQWRKAMSKLPVQIRMSLHKLLVVCPEERWSCSAVSS